LRLFALGADVGWGLTILGATAAVWTFAKEPHADEPVRAAHARESAPGPANWSIAVGNRGLGASFGRSF
jgi:hypothetical protein